MPESAAMQARAGAPSRLLYMLVEVALPASPDLPAHTLRLLYGSGWVRLADGRTFVGQDGDYGSLRGIGGWEDLIGDQASRSTLTFSALSDAAQAQIAQPIAQGSPVQILYGEVDRTTGAPISDPEVIFNGFVDVGHIKVDHNSRTLDMDVPSYGELFFADNDGSGLNSGWHNEFFPGELGFSFVDGVQHPLPWGAKGPRPDQASGSRSYDTDRGGGRTSLRF